MHHDHLPTGGTVSPHEGVDITDIGAILFAATGVRGIGLTAESGGSYCRTEASGGITINIDPDQITGGKELTREAVLAVGFHELCHAFDILEEGHIAHSQADHFFWNLIDDAVIDTRTRRIPALNQPMETLYHTVMADKIIDQTNSTLAEQLMYGLRIQQVLGEQPKLSDQVAATIGGLRNYTTTSGVPFDIIDVLTDQTTGLKERRLIAQQYIKPLYDGLVEQDKAEGRGEQLEQVMAEYEAAQVQHQGSDSDAIPASLPDQIREAIEEAKKAAEESEDSEETPTAEVDESTDSDTADALNPTDEAAIAGRVASEMNLPPAEAAGYLAMALAHQATIRGVAAAFKQLARPAASTQRLTLERQRSSDGPTIHEAALGDIVLRQYGVPTENIFRKAGRSAERTHLAFGGLDIHVLVDVSGSMQSVAPEATAMAVSLLEGLELARTQVAKTSGMKQPDVRTHVVAFGSSAVEIAPLGRHTSGPQKGRTYSSLMNPDASATLINDALLLCRPDSSQSHRDSIILIVGDGAFGDGEAATRTINALPENSYVGQFIIGSAPAITLNHQSVTDVRELPVHLLDMLQKYIRKYQ